ncbi:MAG: ribosome maturation factor RimM [Lactobacillaceae bacterium]|jgi:16S rRNA processing protein RimM|nr:ribosome maturation factor RimM [Lactobacillaceae bacterium]
MSTYKVGTIVNTHGIRGEVKIVPNTDFIEERFSKGSELLIDDKQKVTVKTAKVHKGSLLVSFDEFSNINDVEKFKGLDVFAEGQIEDLEQDDFYYEDIIDLPVYDLEDNLIGQVTDIIALPSNDVWTIKGDKEYMIPYIEDIVKSVDLENKKIVIDAREGLLE